jgi:HPt (histidine-containing phosphotransfer) domain-containing protein
MSEPPLIDAAVLADLAETIGEAGAQSVIALFIAECDNYVAQIAAAAAAADDPAQCEKARRAAHAFRSGAGQVGAAALAAAAFAVERAAADRSPDLPHIAATLLQCAAATLAALRDMPPQ